MFFSPKITPKKKPAVPINARASNIFCRIRFETRFFVIGRCLACLVGEEEVRRRTGPGRAGSGTEKFSELRAQEKMSRTTRKNIVVDSFEFLGRRRAPTFRSDFDKGVPLCFFFFSGRRETSSNRVRDMPHMFRGSTSDVASTRFPRAARRDVVFVG